MLSSVLACPAANCTDSGKADGESGYHSGTLSSTSREMTPKGQADTWAAPKAWCGAGPDGLSAQAAGMRWRQLGMHRCPALALPRRRLLTAGIIHGPS